jgi:ubiquitin carboxyl-terminal hydrolase 10
VTNIKTLPQDHSVRTVQKALSQISEPQGASGLGNASQRVLIEALPPVLVPHLNRVRYGAAAGGITKIGKAIRSGPELEISLGTIITSSQQLRLSKNTP